MTGAAITTKAAALLNAFYNRVIKNAIKAKKKLSEIAQNVSTKLIANAGIKFFFKYRGIRYHLAFPIFIFTAFTFFNFSARRKSFDAAGFSKRNQ